MYEVYIDSFASEGEIVRKALVLGRFNWGRGGYGRIAPAYLRSVSMRSVWTMFTGD